MVCRVRSRLLAAAFAVCLVPGLAAAQSPPSRPAASSSERWITRHPIVTGTLIGAGTGLIWQGALCSGPSCKPGTAALVGAGAGAYGGLIASAIHKARLKQPVGRKTKLGLVAGAIGAIAGSVLVCYGAGGCGGAS
jgi:hypothetical protein